MLQLPNYYNPLMYLAKNFVKQLISKNEIKISPFNDNYFDETAYEMHMSDQLFSVHPQEGEEYFLGSKTKDKQLHNIALKNGTYLLSPKEFLIAKTKESIFVSQNYAGIFDGKASLAQIGLFCNISSVHIDPGTNSTITVELFNCSNYPILLEVGMKIGQVVFVGVQR